MLSVIDPPPAARKEADTRVDARDLEAMRLAREAIPHVPVNNKAKNREVSTRKARKSCARDHYKGKPNVARPLDEANHRDCLSPPKQETDRIRHHLG